MGERRQQPQKNSDPVVGWIHLEDRPMCAASLPNQNGIVCVFVIDVSIHSWTSCNHHGIGQLRYLSLFWARLQIVERIDVSLCFGHATSC